MHTGIVKNGVILSVLGGHMRKFKRFPSRGLRFRLLLVVTGGLLLMAAFAPSAKADVIAYFNFEDAANGSPPDFTSEADQGLGVVATITTNYAAGAMTTVAGLPQNRLAADTDNPPNGLHGLGLSRSGANSPADFDIVLNSAQGIFQAMTVSFAINAQGNGFTLATIQFSTDGGGTFATAGSTVIPNSGTIVVSQALPAAANNTPLLTIRIELTGGQSNGANLQNVIDNILIGGTIVPEPATVAGGLLGVLGLCWLQRRRLIRSVRFRHT
jgi:hypothetical protein